MKFSTQSREAELGFTLFNRGKNGVTMTSYGASLYPSIRAVLNSDEALQQSIARLNGLEKGKVKLGAFNSVCAGLLGVRLAGDAWYHGVLHKKEYIGDALRQIEHEDIPRACRLMYGTTLLALLLGCAVRLLIFSAFISFFHSMFSRR